MSAQQRRLACLLGITFVLTLISVPQTPLSAQNDDDDGCTTLVEDALQLVGSACAEMGRNEACYGHNAIDVTLQENVSATFGDSGDLVNIEDLIALETQPANPEDGTWGIAFVSAQADFPEESEDNLTLVLLGDTRLWTDEEFDDDTTQAFILESTDAEMCEDAPDGLLITAPEGQRARIVVNSVELVMSSTLFVTAQTDDVMALQGLDGQIDVTADGQTESLTAGFFTTVPLDGLTSDGPPEPPEPIPPGDEFPLNIQTSLADSVGGEAGGNTSGTALPQTYSDDLVTFSYPDGWGAIRIESRVEFSNNPDLINVRPAPGTNTIIPSGSLTGLVMTASDYSRGDYSDGGDAIRAFANGIFFEQRQDWIIEGPTLVTIGEEEVTTFTHLLPSTGMDDLRIANYGFRNYVIAILFVDTTVPFEDTIEAIIQSVE